MKQSLTDFPAAMLMTVVRGYRSRLRPLLAAVLVTMVRGYQMLLRPLLPGAVCRFTPSCSEYFIEAVHKYGPLRGAGKGIGRICRCHPWHPGGFDPP